MILRSGKVGEIEEKDIISDLPVSLVGKIISLLPDADATRTRILSKRWEYFWALLPNLHFEMDTDWSIEQVNKFFDTVDRTLTLRDGMTIQRFLLKCYSNGCYYKRVYELFRKVVHCKVQEIDVDISYKFNSFEARSLWNLFKTCNTLVGLTLDRLMFDFSENELLFPYLKTIKLKSIYFSSDEVFVNLIFGCPVLKELFLESLFGGNGTFKVSSPSLKRLSISFVVYEEVVIDALMLEYLDVLDCNVIYFLTKPLSLVEVHISISDCDIKSELFTSLSSAKLLTLTGSTVNVFSELHGLNVPVFPNLVKLVIDIYCIDDWNFLLVLLNNMPNLEHITFDHVLPYCEHYPPFNAPEEVPDCLRVKMKEIIIHEWDGKREDAQTILDYLLKHAENLEILKVGLELWDFDSASS